LTQRAQRCVKRTLRGACVVWTCLVLGVSRAEAHGPPPAAVAIVSADDVGPRVVRLTRGLAQRQPSGELRYVCAALWDGSDGLPAYGLPGQAVLVLGSSGLFVLSDDGRVARHPDPAAIGATLDVTALGDTLFVLRKQAGGSEIVQVTPEHIEHVWSDDTLWTSLTAGDDFLALAGLHETDDTTELSVVRLTPQGKVLERVREPNAPTAPVTRSVIARAVGRELYLVITSDEGRQLVQLVTGELVATRAANNAIAGPVQTRSGQAWVALDSVLQPLRPTEPNATQLTAATQHSAISCMGRYGDRSYVCTHDGIDALEASDVGAPLFELSQLTAPSLVGLPPSVADACDLQWQDFRFDLLSYGITLVEPDAQAADNADAGASSVTPATPAQPPAAAPQHARADTGNAATGSTRLPADGAGAVAQLTTAGEPEQVSSPSTIPLSDRRPRARSDASCSFVTRAPTNRVGDLLAGCMLGLSWAIACKAWRRRNRCVR